MKDKYYLEYNKKYQCYHFYCADQLAPPFDEEWEIVWSGLFSSWIEAEAAKEEFKKIHIPT